MGKLLKVGLANWVSIDPRSAGLFRIALGLICAIDALRRLEYVELFYSNVGTLSNHYALFRPFTRHNLSLLNALSSPGEVYVFFWGTILASLLLMVGYRTRLFQVLVAVGIMSIHSRNIMLENGGDVVLNLWLLWTFFLPLGERYSVDAFRRSMRERKESSSAELNAPFTDRRARFWSLAVLAVLLQLGVIYLFNTLHKSGPTWRDGSAIAWVLEQDRIVRPFGLWMKTYAPFQITQLLSWGTLVVEGMAPLLIFSPFFTTWTRRVAIVTLCGLHLGIFLITDVGLFSWDMMISYLLLLTAPDFVLIRGWLRRLAGQPITVLYDSDCGVCHLSARAATRLDRLGLITWAGRDLEVGYPPGYGAERLASERDSTLIAWEPKSGQIWTRHLAVARVAAALPLGRLVAWTAKIPGLSALLGTGYDAFAERRHHVSAWLGMGACGIDGPKLEPALSSGSSPARLHLRRAGWVIAQGLLIYFMAAATTQVMIENRSISTHIKITQPDWAQATIQYGRWYQGWGMFAPNAPTRDGALVIDAVLADGRHIDPQTGMEPIFAVADAHRMKWDQFWGSYSMRIASKRRSAFRNEFSKWLRNPKIRHLKLGPEVQIKSFTVWWIGDRSPDPRHGGSPTEIERYKVVEWAGSSVKNAR